MRAVLAAIGLAAACAPPNPNAADHRFESYRVRHGGAS